MMYDFGLCPNCQGEITLRPFFIPGRPEQEFVWWARCPDCAHLTTRPSKALAEQEDADEWAFMVALKAYLDKMGKAELPFRQPRPSGKPPAKGDCTHDCRTCVHFAHKGEFGMTGAGEAIYCMEKQAFLVDRRARTICNQNKDCADWVPVLEGSE